MLSGTDSRSEIKPFKLFLQRQFLGSAPPILVASIGRSGSTLVWDAVADAIARDRFGPFARFRKVRNFTKGPAFFLDLDPIVPGGVFKTHDLPGRLAFKGPVKAIFVYGAARDAALSVYSSAERFGPHWTAQHLRHFRREGDYREILNHDLLGFEEQIRQWALEPRIETLLIHYDALWDHQDDLSRFVGAEVMLPPRRERETPSYSPEIVIAATKTYAALDRRIEQLPRCGIARA